MKIKMECDFCKTDYKDEFLRVIKVDAGEKVSICNDCEENLKELIL
jgi:hypothetical protein